MSYRLRFRGVSVSVVCVGSSPVLGTGGLCGRSAAYFHLVLSARMCGAIPALRHPFSRQVTCLSTDTTSMKLTFLIFKHANLCCLQTDIASRNAPNFHTGVDCKCDRCFEHVQPFYLMGIPTGLRPRRRRNPGFIPGRDKRISFKAFNP